MALCRQLFSANVRRRCPQLDINLFLSLPGETGSYQKKKGFLSVSVVASSTVLSLCGQRWLFGSVAECRMKEAREEVKEREDDNGRSGDGAGMKRRKKENQRHTAAFVCISLGPL